MRIDKAQVIDILKSLGKDTSLAARDLPDQVDTDEHAELLGRCGLTEGELLEQFQSGSADPGTLVIGAADAESEEPHADIAAGLPGAGAIPLRGVGLGGGVG